MKSKRIVYFDEKNEQTKTQAKRQSTSKKNLSISKTLRQTSNSKQLHKHTPSGKISGSQKMGNSQKIKILLIKDGFIFQKKYMIYDIQCILTKQQKTQKSTTKINIIQNQTALDPNDQSIIQDKTDQDFLFLNFETNSFGVTKGMVKHNFTIQKDNTNYIQVRTVGYHIENLMISNKRIDFVQIAQGQQKIDENQITMIQPMKLVEESQMIREQKLKNNTLRLNSIKLQGRKASKSLNFCWSMESTIDNCQSSCRQVHRKNQSQYGILMFNPPITGITTNQISHRQTSKTKRIGSSICQNNKQTRDNISKLNNLVQLMKPTRQSITVTNAGVNGKNKNNSKKFLNDSGLSYSALNKIQGKQNTKKEDAYGLEEINKRSRNKTAHTEQIKRVTQPSQIDLKKIQIQTSKYGFVKK